LSHAEPSGAVVGRSDVGTLQRVGLTESHWLSLHFCARGRAHSTKLVLGRERGRVRKMPGPGTGSTWRARLAPGRTNRATQFCLVWGHVFHKKQTTALEIPRGNGAFSLLALSLLYSLTDSSNPVRPAPGENPVGKIW